MRRFVLTALLLLLMTAAPGTARADNAAGVAKALRSSGVYQAPGLDLVDVAALSGRLAGTDPRVVVAVLPASAASSADQAFQRAVEIRRALGDPGVVVLVVTANRHLGADAGPDAAARGVDARAALQAELAQNSGAFDKATVTAFAEAFAQRIADQAGAGGAVPPSGTGGQPRAPSSTGSEYTGAYVVGGLVVAGGGAVAVASRRSRRKKQEQLSAARADAVQLYDRLGSDVSSLDPGQDPVARQALVDAADRYNATGGALASARSPAELAAARRSALEGLTAAQTARRALGLDPGPELPSLHAGGPQLTGDQTVRVGDQEYAGSPSYRPGRGHYFEGGYVGGGMVPGGWYSAPFWTPFLLGSVLSGGFGGGGLFGGGFEREEGSDDGGGEDGGGGGADWGGGGGGDWGGGGSGGGDSGGGGDW